MKKKAVIASRLSHNAREYILSKNIEIISFAENINVDKRLAFHSDLSFFYDGKDTLFIAKETEQYKQLLNQYCENIVVLNEYLGKKYPDDVLLNCVVLGNKFICNPETVSQMILEKMKNDGFDIIGVNQGYTKCSVLPVTENAIITDDNSIACECGKSGIDVLLVSKGSVVLDGFDYGFIGGTAGKISESEIVFNGDIKKHTDYEKIHDFLIKYKVSEVSFDNTLEDIGSIILIGG